MYIHWQSLKRPPQTYESIVTCLSMSIVKHTTCQSLVTAQPGHTRDPHPHIQIHLSPVTDSWTVSCCLCGMACALLKQPLLLITLMGRGSTMSYGTNCVLTRPKHAHEKGNKQPASPKDNNCDEPVLLPCPCGTRSEHPGCPGPARQLSHSSMATLAPSALRSSHCQTDG